MEKLGEIHPQFIVQPRFEKSAQWEIFDMSEENSDTRKYYVQSNTETLGYGALCHVVFYIMTEVIKLATFDASLIGPSSLISFGISGIVWTGLFNTAVGFQSSMRFLGSRTGKCVTEGLGWAFPVIYSRERIDIRDKDYDLGPKNFLSLDNVPTSADTSAVAGIDNAARSETYDGDLDTFLKNLVEEGARRYILDHRAMSTEMFRPRSELTREEIIESQEQTAKFKQDIETNGRRYVRDHVNDNIRRYGISCRQVIIENVRLPEDIEGAGGEALREALESAGDDVDWENTEALVRRAIDNMIERGLNYEGLSPSQQVELYNTVRDQVLAKKKQVKRFSVTGGGIGAGAAAIFGGSSND